MAEADATGSDAPPLRSALFVPANRADLLEKALRSGADAVLADLEDSVPNQQKATARATLRAWLSDLNGDDLPHIVVRINSIGGGALAADIQACMHDRVRAVLVPKIETEADVTVVANALDQAERMSGRESPVYVWPTIETARAVCRAYEIATAHERVRYVGGSAGDEGDLARSIGFRWTASFTETLYVRSKVLVDVRAAGIANPMTGVVTNLQNPGEVEAFALQSRDLGYDGMMVIHPTHVPIVNTVFGISPERAAWAEGVLAALDHAAESGSGALRYGGMMVDVAMAATARQILQKAKAFD